MMEKTLQYQRIKVLEHKKCLVSMMSNYRIILFVTLFPTFLWGLTKGRETRWGKIIKQLMKLGILTSFSHIKRQLLMP